MNPAATLHPLSKHHSHATAVSNTDRDDSGSGGGREGLIIAASVRKNIQHHYHSSETDGAGSTTANKNERIIHDSNNHHPQTGKQKVVASSPQRRPRAGSNTATSVSTINTKNETVTCTVTGVDGTAATTTNATRSSDNAFEAVLLRNQRRMQEAEQRREASKSKKSIICCAMPLSVIFGIQIALVVAVFIIIIVVVNVTTMDVTSELINDSITNSLLYAEAQISSPISAAEAALNEYRTRYLSYVDIHSDSLEPCDDHSPTLQASALFYSESVAMLQSYPLMGNFFAVKRVAPVTPETLARAAEAMANGDLAPPFSLIADKISLCSVSDRTILRRLALNASASVSAPFAVSPNVSVIETTVIPVMGQYSALDTGVPQLARARDDYSEHEDRQVSIVLNTPRFTWVPRIRLNPDTNAAEYTLVGTVPVAVNVTYDAIGSTPATTVHHSYAEQNIDAFVVGVNGVLRVDVVDGLGCMLDLTGFSTLLKQITPAHALAHTSLYIWGEVLLTSSYFTEAHLTYSGEHYHPAGNTPFETIDYANHVCHRSPKMASGEVVVFTEDLKDPQTGVSVVVSCNAFALPISNRTFVVIQSTPHSFYFGHVTMLRTVLIALGVCSAFVVVFISVFIAVAVNIGVSQLLSNMAVAAAMKGRETIFIRTFVSEIEQLAKGFGRMNDRLLAAAPYLPQHLLVTTDESANDDDRDEEGTVALSAQHTSHPSTARGGGGRKGSRSKGSSAPHHLPPTGGVPVGGGGIATKRVTLLALNTRGFHTSVSVNTPSTISKPTTDLTQLVVEAAHGHKGVIDSFHGDHFVVSFNAARQCAEGPLKAAHCALEIGAAGHSIGRLFAMGISSGRACVGNLGCATAKRLSIIGPVYSKAMALEKLCRRFNAPFGADLSDLNTLTQCVVDGSMAQEIHHSFVLQVLGGVYGTPFAQPPNGMFLGSPAEPRVTALSAKNGVRPSSHQPPQQRVHPDILYALRMQIGANSATDEWLYEMQNNKHGPMGDLNKAMLRYVDGCTEALLAGVAPSFLKAPTANGTNLVINSVQSALDDLESNVRALSADAAALGLLFCSSVGAAGNGTVGAAFSSDDNGNVRSFIGQYQSAHHSPLNSSGIRVFDDDRVESDPATVDPSEPESTFNGTLTHDAVFLNCLLYAEYIASQKCESPNVEGVSKSSPRTNQLSQQQEQQQRLILNGCPAYNCRQLQLPPALYTI